MGCLCMYKITDKQQGLFSYNVPYLCYIRNLLTASLNHMTFKNFFFYLVMLSKSLEISSRNRFLKNEKTGRVYNVCTCIRNLYMYM